MPKVGLCSWWNKEDKTISLVSMETQVDLFIFKVQEDAVYEPLCD